MELATWRELLWCSGAILAGYTVLFFSPWAAVACVALMIPRWMEKR